jgi:phage shock protein C
MSTKLYRSQSDKMIAGVCGGLSRYLGIDATLVRLFFLLLGFANGGIAILIYFILWIVMPPDEQTIRAGMEDTLRAGTAEIADSARTFGDDIRRTLHDRPRDVALVFGIALVILDCLFLVQNLGIPWLHWFSFDLVWPVLLIAGGIVMLLRQTKGA